MGGESCTVLRLRLMRKLAMSHIWWPGLQRHQLCAGYCRVHGQCIVSQQQQQLLYIGYLSASTDFDLGPFVMSENLYFDPFSDCIRISMGRGI